MKKLIWLSASGTFFGSLVYAVVSLNRWEWNRALLFGLVALIAEVGLATGLVLRRLDAPGRRPADRAPTAHGEVRAVLRETRPRPARFAWLDPKEVMTRSNVFITMLVGGGVILSALAWVVDKVAARTTTSLAEGRLAGDLSRIAYPGGGLYVDDVTVLAQTLPHLDDPDLRRLLGSRE